MLVGAIRIATVWRLRCQRMLSTLVNRIVSALKTKSFVPTSKKIVVTRSPARHYSPPFMIAPTPPPSPDNDYGRIIELLVYTGCRRDEIGGPNGPKSVWKPTNQTSGRAHEKRILSRGLFGRPSACHSPRQGEGWRGKRPFAFGEGKGGYSGWSRSKRALYKQAKVKN